MMTFGWPFPPLYMNLIVCAEGACAGGGADGWTGGAALTSSACSAMVAGCLSSPAQADSTSMAETDMAETDGFSNGAMRAAGDPENHVIPR